MILLIEHDASVRELVAEILEDEGLAIATVASISDGLEALERTTPAALLLDVRPGDGGGHRLIRWCASQSRLAELPIIVMATLIRHDLDGDSAVTAVIPKPFDIDELVDAVKRVISGRAALNVALIG
jgi:DNA-binding response OmpR family regulator